jgi:hypothetical protein
VEELEARVTLKFKDGTQGPWHLPRWEMLSVGRTHGYGLHLPNSWVPSKLCRFLPWDQGWVVQVGPRARMRVQDEYVGDHVFERRAMVAIQEGEMLLSFPELDDYCQLGLVIGLGAGDSLPMLHDSDILERPGGGTRYAGAAVAITPAQRTIVATTFAYLLKGEPKPVNITATAATECGKSEQVIKNNLGKVRDKVNRERWGPKLKSYEDLGHYLIHLTRTISWEDLPEHLR